MRISDWSSDVCSSDLSGGGTLGMFHLGVIKALHQHKLLPRVLSGASAGSIIASAVAVRDDAALDAMFEPDGLNLEAFQPPGCRAIISGAVVVYTASLDRPLKANIRTLPFADS